MQAIIACINKIQKYSRPNIVTWTGMRVVERSRDDDIIDNVETFSWPVDKNHLAFRTVGKFL